MLAELIQSNISTTGLLDRWELKAAWSAYLISLHVNLLQCKKDLFELDSLFNGIHQSVVRLLIWNKEAEFQDSRLIRESILRNSCHESE